MLLLQLALTANIGAMS